MYRKIVANKTAYTMARLWAPLGALYRLKQGGGNKIQDIYEAEERKEPPTGPGYLRSTWAKKVRTMSTTSSPSLSVQTSRPKSSHDSHDLNPTSSPSTHPTSDIQTRYGTLFPPLPCKIYRLENQPFQSGTSRPASLLCSGAGESR